MKNKKVQIMEFGTCWPLSVEFNSESVRQRKSADKLLEALSTITDKLLEALSTINCTKKNQKTPYSVPQISDKI